MPHGPSVISSHPSQVPSSHSPRTLCTSHPASLLLMTCQGCCCHRAFALPVALTWMLFLQMSYTPCLISSNSATVSPPLAALFNIATFPYLYLAPSKPLIQLYLFPLPFHCLMDTIIYLFTRLPVNSLSLLPLESQFRVKIRVFCRSLVFPQPLEQYLAHSRPSKTF